MLAVQLLLIAALVGLDQWVKYWVVTSLKPVGSIGLIDGVLHFTYVENTGAAFGMFDGGQIVLSVVVALLIITVLVLLATKKIPGKILPWMGCLVAAGGIGNFIDRLVHGFVVDFIDFRLIHFAVFNIADSCIVVGVCVAAVLVLFTKEGAAFSEKKPITKAETSEKEEAKQEAQDER